MHFFPFVHCTNSTAPCTEGVSASTDLRSALPKECCVNSTRMQVDPTSMNVADGGPVIREAGASDAASARMVGNPPQTLAPELRADGPLSQQTNIATVVDCKASDVSTKGSDLNPRPEAPPCPQHDPGTLSLGPVPANTASSHKNMEVLKPGADDVAIFPPTQQWTCGKKAPLNPSHGGGGNPSKRTHTQVQSVISLPAGFQCSSLFKPGQPVTFLPSATFGSPLCKITLPPGLGQIAALREAAASQFRVECRPQCSSTSVTPNLRTFPYHFSTARALVPETRPPAKMVHKNRHLTVSGSKSSKAGEKHSSPQDSASSSAIAHPAKQPALVPAPQPLPLPPVSVSPSTPPSAITTHIRLINHLEKGPPRQSADKTSLTYARLKSPCTVVHTGSELRDVPLDLSAKSKRPKTAKDPQNASMDAEHYLAADVSQEDDPIPTKRTVSSAFVPGAPLSIFPESQRNGTPSKQAPRILNHQAHQEPLAPWAKSPHGSTNNVAGTYVGVASPILASTLCSKDGKGAAFVEDLQNTAKQVTISIIDQGEQLVSRVKKGPSVVKENQHFPGSKYSNSACLPGMLVCATKDSFPTVLSISDGSQPHCKTSSGRMIIPHSPADDSPAQHQPVPLPHQGSTTQQKVAQVNPKLWVTAGCEGPLFQSAHTSSSKMPEKKWGKTKSPLSNLESIVKQKALETSALSGEGCRNLGPVGARRPQAVSLHLGSRDVPAGGFPPLRHVKRRDGKPELESLEGIPAKISCKQEKWSIPEVREKAFEKRIKQEKITGSEDCSDKSRLTTHAQILGGGGPAERNGVETKMVQQPAVERSEDKPVSEGLSPCVKLEGITLSILKGQCADAAEQWKELNVTREGSPSKGEAAVGKYKKASRNKLNKSSSASSKKMATCLKRSREQDSGTSEWHHRRKKKQRASSQPDTAPSQLPEEWEEISSGRRGLTDVPQLPRIKTAGNESSPNADAPCSQGSPGWLNKEAGPPGSCPPKLKRGRRRRTDDTRQGVQSPPAVTVLPLPPPPPAPQTQIRRPRGRPRSTPLPNQAALVMAKPAPDPEGDPSPRKKRKRRRNRKYQNGEYVMERDQAGEVDGKSVTTRQATRAGTDQRVGLYPRLSATLAVRGASPDATPKRPLLTRLGAIRHSEHPASPEPVYKPSGKRKFKSKHLSDTEEEDKKTHSKTKRGGAGRRSTSLVANGDSPPVKKPPGLRSPSRWLSSPPASRRGSAGRGRAPETPTGRPVPPEVRRLIVNKNAGETLLQRASRLGYQEVVLYCLEKDEREVNRRDNAGYTALHEACARGWTHIVQVLLQHGADVNCSAQDGTRPIHDAVASDNLPAVWMLLSHGADPTLATYSGQTAIKLAHSHSMKTFLRDYFADLDGQTDQDPSVHWDFYSSAVFEVGQEACWDLLLSFPEEEKEEVNEKKKKKRVANTEEDCFMFEFSSQPLLPCYYIQVLLSQGFCNWFILSDVLKRLKMSVRIFRARYPHLEVVSVSWAELCRQVSVSQVMPLPYDPQTGEDEVGGQVELVRCVPDLQELLGSSVHFLEEEPSDKTTPRGGQRPLPAHICPSTDSQTSKSGRSNRKEER
ncbi:hypothetical protein AAFF_G00433470 [Aldrovandia affinis]|uniref:BCL-6 corepressor PCGF1 binding domain-containing protein n=1 Tax=Aldrovandia affinis TaxID=143900 RepID=A0AAD7S8N4_9TELE|nr:hypothetical protein AAFF_G00433470 [Aldrovandia affinis]